MLRKIYQLVVGFLCGLLFIEWFPIAHPISMSEVFAACILKPVHFLAAAIVFIFGFLVNAVVIGEGINLIVNNFLNRKLNFFIFLYYVGFLSNFIILFLIGFWQTVVFFCFSILYGIISIDFEELKLGKV